MRGEREEESYIVFEKLGKLIHYNFKSKTFCKICDVNKKLLELTEWYNAHQYVASLAYV